MAMNIEPLESRRLLTTARFLDADILTINANAGDDAILLETTSVPGMLVIHVNAEAPLQVPLTAKKPGRDIVRVLVDGMEGNDSITANIGIMQMLRGGEGNDTIESSAGRLEVLGGAGDDRITATATNPDELMLSGEQGNDVITAMQEGTRATVLGGSGRDRITTGAGIDHIWGGPGSDTITAGGGDDIILSGKGDDIIYGDDSLGSATGDDWIFAMAGNDTVFGGSGDDHLFGQAGDDQLTGGAGSDTLFGGGGNDTMITGAGDLFRGREYRRFDRLLAVLVPESGYFF